MPNAKQVASGVVVGVITLLVYEMAVKPAVASVLK